MNHIIQKNMQIDLATRKLYDYLHTMDYGQTITWQELANNSGAQLSQTQLYYVCNAVNEMLMSNVSRCLTSVTGVGKRIINPSEHSMSARKTAKRSVRIYEKAGKILASTNLDKLSDDEKNQVINDANKFRTLQLFTEVALKKKQLKGNDGILGDFITKLGEK